MTIFQPDAHPGRCQNYRWFPTGVDFDMYRAAVRCNGMEGTEHACWFTAPPKPVINRMSSNTQSAQVHNPQPWIEPEKP